MADGYIAVAPDSNGKFLQTFENSVSGNVVHAEAVALVDSTGNYLSALPVTILSSNTSSNINTANVSVRIFQGANFSGSGQVTLSNVSTTIAAARATRRSVTIRNQDSSNSGYIGPAPIGTSNGLLLYPGDSISVDYTGIIAGISASTSNVTFGYLETYD